MGELSPLDRQIVPFPTEIFSERTWKDGQLVSEEGAL
jgi:hypothetical protein